MDTLRPATRILLRPPAEATLKLHAAARWLDAVVFQRGLVGRAPALEPHLSGRSEGVGMSVVRSGSASHSDTA